MTLTEIFEQACPMYIVYGMTYEQFWFGDPWMVKAYREAHLLKRKMLNEELWIAGMYNYNGFGAVIATAFGKHREDYLKKPLNLFPKTETERKAEEREKKHRLIRALTQWKRNSDNKQKQKTGE